MGAMTRLTLIVLRGARLGSTATYKISGKSAHARIVGGTGSVTVGGPSFGLESLADHTGLKVGSNLAEPVRFTHVGNRPRASRRSSPPRPAWTSANLLSANNLVPDGP